MLIAGLFHETNTFVDQPTPMSGFDFRRGGEMLACTGDAALLGGALETAAVLGWRVEPLLDARAVPSGLVEDAVFEEYWREFQERAARWKAGEIDGMLLILHGAMVTRTCCDVEGELLRRIRGEPGFEHLPIVAVLDLHANVTPLMARHASALLAYRENPHTDARETAQRAARLLDRVMSRDERVHTEWRGVPIIWPPGGTGTSFTPMADLEKMARECECAFSEILAVNVCAGFSFADTPDTGVSFSVVHSGQKARAEEILDRLSTLAWEQRECGNVRGIPLDEALARIRDEGGGPYVLAEESDNIGGGAPGDGTGLLRGLIKFEIENAAVCLADADAVRALNGLRIGDSVTLPLGGRGSRYDAGPLTVEVKLLGRSDGRFQLEDKQSHLASVSGDSFEMGPSVLVQHRGILILLTTRRVPPMDLGQWKCVGVDPARLSVIGVKAAVAHRRAYDPIAKENILIETPGSCCGDLRRLDYRHVRRPVYPLDTVVR